MSQASGKVINWSTKPLTSPPISRHIWFQAGHVKAHRCHKAAGVVQYQPGVAVVDACKYVHLPMEAEVSKASAKAINWSTKP